MKILLVGEYSRLHNSLKEGLLKKDHEVTIIGGGDFFKRFSVDIRIKYNYEKGINKLLLSIAYRFFGVDLKSRSIKKQFFSNASKLKDFDVVQLINESPLGASPKVTMEMIQFLRKNNSKMFLLSCGTDHLSVKYAFEKKFRYSILTPLFEGKVSEKSFNPILKYLEPRFKDLHQFVYSNVDGVIASDMDYHIPLEGHSQYKGLIPNPVNLDKIPFQQLVVKEKVIVFHGINRENYYKKGSDYFEEAIAIVQQKHPEKFDVITVESVPYNEYIRLYDSAHILLDQVLGYDQGYNALEAMAKGKVVFTGAETEFMKYYNLNETVAINVIPNSQQIADQLENLLLHPERIQQISKAARAFIEKEHDYQKIAEKYLKVWTA